MKKFFINCLLVVGLFAQVSNASSITLSANAGGLASGSTRLTFDSLIAGSNATVVLPGVTLSFSDSAQVVAGSDSLYAPPYISGSNGLGFGNEIGRDSTPYLTTGAGTITFDFGGVAEKYFGLLWGSVDTYNYITFYLGGAQVGSFSGFDLDAMLYGDRGACGTFYVDFKDAGLGFDKVVLSSAGYAFELDNVAFNTSTAVPDAAGTFGLFGLCLAGFVGLRRRR